MGQPMLDVAATGGPQEVEIPGQRGAPAAGESPLLPFRDYMHQQADALRRGEITVDNFPDFWRAAGSLKYCGYDIHETYTAPDGTSLFGPDEEAADLLWRMREPESWKLRHDAGEPQSDAPESTKLTAEDLSCVAEVFRHYDGVCELDIDADELDRIASARQLVSSTLGIDGHNRFSLGELAQKITARLELSDAIAHGAFAELFRSVVPPRRRAIAVVAMVDVVSPGGDVHSEPISQGGTVAPVSQQREEVDKVDKDESPVVVFPSDITHRRRVLPGFDDRTGSDIMPGQRTIRSHERPRRHPHLVRRAVAAIALTAVMVAGAFFTKQEVLDHRPSTPAVVKVDPRLAISKTPVEPPPVQMRPPADRMIAIGGDYNPVARTGAIWFNVEDYAAELGYSHLTMLQTYLLTDKCMQYMDTKVPGGMSWDKATRIASNAQLPYPPDQLMRTWINQIIAQTTQSTATHLDDIT